MFKWFFDYSILIVDDEGEKTSSTHKTGAGISTANNVLYQANFYPPKRFRSSILMNYPILDMRVEW